MLSRAAVSNIGTLDVSKYDFPSEIWHILPEWEVGVKTATFIPLIVFGLIGNLLLLNVIMRNRSLRTPTNLLIANMASADLLTLIFCPVMFMFHDFFQNYQLGAVGCRMEGFLEGAFLVTAVLNLCAVSYDRLTAIVLPMETRLTLFGAKCVMASTWIAGVLLSVPLAVYRNYRERQWKNFLETYCTEDVSILPMYWHVLISALVWFPLAVMAICYSAIFYKLDRYEAHVLKREHPIAVSYKRKVAKMLFIVVVTFIILRVPFTALIFVRNQMLKESTKNQINGSFHILWYTSHYLIFLNAAVNPLIYGLTNDNFRKAYHQTPMLKHLWKSATPTEKAPNRSRIFFGSLQPRGPCGDDKYGGASFWGRLNPNKSRGIVSHATKTTNLQPSTSQAAVSQKDHFTPVDEIRVNNSMTDIKLRTEEFI